MKTLNTILLFLIMFLFHKTMAAQGKINVDGSDLWFTNMQVSEEMALPLPEAIFAQESSPTFALAIEELKEGLSALYHQDIPVTSKPGDGVLYVATSAQKLMFGDIFQKDFDFIGDEGFVIKEDTASQNTWIAANSDIGILYGVFHYLRVLQTGTGGQSPLYIVEKPSYSRRILNHWDNLDGTVERGYAGGSIWKWADLPQKIDARYKAYAKANASIGINGTVLNNVNANPEILAPGYLAKVKAIADELRPYGLKIYLSVNFSSPQVIGNLPTSDPLDIQVQLFWENKVEEIYNLVPDFGGFLVKANSEGLPGPQDFGRTHADGANLLADALKPYNGIVMWRAFVYAPNSDDRAKQAYDEFVPLDGKFHDNVLVQVKNGPVDFQPREPFSPLFGSLDYTPLMPELQITQEYLGFSDHLVYLGTLYQEFLVSDTHIDKTHSRISDLTDGTTYNTRLTGIAGVANIGSDANWCGHHFAQANWYVFGRLAWDNHLPARAIAEEWLKQTFTHDRVFVNEMAKVMMESREATVDYMTPLGLHHLMGWGDHHGPEPWCEVPGARADWLPSYYHQADSFGIGFNRSSTGSNAVAQYSKVLKYIFDNPGICPEEYLLWFHHLPWGHKMHNGNDLWTELCIKYSSGVDQVKLFQSKWDSLKVKVDEKRHFDVQKKLAIQLKEAIWWRDACLLYFQTYSQKEIPMSLDRPNHNLEELKKLKFNSITHN